MINNIIALKVAVIFSILCLIDGKILNQNLLYETGHNINSSEIDLREKSIDYIDLNTFRKFPNIQVIYLEDNKIRKIEKDLLKNLTNLRELWLEDNLLVDIDKDIFNGLNKLEKVCLFNNPIFIFFPNQMNLLCEKNLKCTVIFKEKCKRQNITTISTTKTTTFQRGFLIKNYF